MDKHLVQSDTHIGPPLESRWRRLRHRLSSELPALGRRGRTASIVAAASLIALSAAGELELAGLLLVALAGLVTGLVRPELLGPLVLLLLPAGRSVAVLDAQVAPLEAVVGGGAIGYVAGVALRRVRPRLLLADWAFGAFVLFAATSLLGPVDTSDRAREVVFWGALGVVFHVVHTHTRTRREVTLLFVGLAGATLVEAAWALFEYVDAWSERFSLLEGAIVFPLPSGSLGHPNALAQFLVVAGLGTLALALSQRGAVRVGGLAVAGLAVLALVVTFSRSSWVALVAGAAVYLLEPRARRTVLALGAMGAAAAAVLVLQSGAIGSRISTLVRLDTAGLYDFRLELVERGARAVAEHPLTGVDRFVEAGLYAGRPDLATHPHNLFLGVAVFFGVPAMLAFGVLFVLAVRAAWRARAAARSRSASGVVPVGYLAVYTAMVVNGLFEYPFWNPTLSVLALVSLSIALAFPRFLPTATTATSRPSAAGTTEARPSAGFRSRS